MCNTRGKAEGVDLYKPLTWVDSRTPVYKVCRVHDGQVRKGSVMAKESVTMNDTAIVRQKLDEVEIEITFNLKNDKDVKVEGVKCKLVFTGTTVFEALKFASGGQSFRVAIQAKLRKLSKAELLAKTHVIAMSDVFNPPKRTFVRKTDEESAKDYVKRRLAEGASQEEIMAELVK